MFGMTEERLGEILNGLIKIGEVSVIYPDKGTARVVFDDDDSVVSAELKVLQKNTFRNHDYGMPDIGEDVVCLFLPCAPEDGFIIGSFYAGEVKPEENTGDLRTVVFDDETRIGYDRKAHKLFIEIDREKEKTVITADQKEVYVQVGKGATEVTMTEKKIDVNLVSGKTTVVMDENMVDIDTTVKADVKAPAIILDGNVTITGTLLVQGAVTTQSGITDSVDVVSSGISLVTHTHAGCQGGSTGTPK